MDTKKQSSFTEAVKSKYLDYDGIDENPGILFPTLAGKSKSLLYERSEKLNSHLKALERRTEIDLKCCSIGFVDHDSEMFDKLRNVQILDVSFNQLTSWRQISDLVRNLQSLRHIIVTGNPLEILSDDEYQQLSQYFSKIKIIILGKLNYDWSKIVLCSKYLWPQLEELDVFDNLIDSIEAPAPEMFNNLTTLILNGNQLINWKYINNLGNLKKLTCLKLVNCGIESVEIDENENLFLSLKHLDLKTNRLNSWKDIANLNKLPALEELIVRDNPLFEDMNFDYTFNFVLSIVGRLKYLNRQQITDNLRRDGEIHYLRFYYSKYLKSIEAGDETFLEENPRYLQILQDYGTPFDLSAKNKAKKAPNKLIELTICDLSTGTSIIKKIPRTIMVTALKHLVKRLLSIDDMKEISIWVKSKNDFNQEIEYEMDKDEHNLDFYSCKDNDLLVIKYN
ncbi:tubulin-specific chaperone E-like [Tetranychus urticae]|uniref:Ubiquitin-like domain-containing protein n=1 Tax=Tetranychus urticae TaxID=32264 RepID=T1K289_TETUR|nr:tubulin-specific chaperone E-like [Tetranychus urticae]